MKLPALLHKSIQPAALLHLEGAILLIMTIVLYGRLGGHWGLFVLLLLVPDLSMAGYLGGPALGAVVYNIFHTYLLPAVLAALGLFAGYPLLIQLALIWLAHLGMDRMLGFGLKYSTAFKETHLNRV